MRSASRRPWGDVLLGVMTRGAAVIVLLMLLGLVGILGLNSIPAFQRFGTEFFTGSDWRPNERQGEILRNAQGKPIIEDGEVQRGPSIPPSFGALPVIYGTFVSSAIALLVAVPLSFGTALFVVRVAPRLRPSPVLATLLGAALTLGAALALYQPVHRLGISFLDWTGLPHPLLGWGAVAGFVGCAFVLLRYCVANIADAVSFLVEFLAAIPSLAYGVWGVFVLAPLMSDRIIPFFASTLGNVPGMRWFFYDTTIVGGVVTESQLTAGRNMLTGSLILAIMIIPIITALSRDVLKAVPRAQIEGSLALGATWWQSCVGMLRYGRSGLFGAVMLGLARAAGETMAVTMVIGNQAQIAPSPLAPAQTMASLLANEFADANDQLHRSALLLVALILLTMSLVFNVVARKLIVGSASRSSMAH